MHLAGHASGYVAVTDIHDSFVANAIEGIEVGDFVRCRVIRQADPKATNHNSREKRGAALLGNSQHDIKIVSTALDAM